MVLLFFFWYKSRVAAVFLLKSSHMPTQGKPTATMSNKLPSVPEEVEHALSRAIKTQRKLDVIFGEPLVRVYNIAHSTPKDVRNIMENRGYSFFFTPTKSDRLLVVGANEEMVARIRLGLMNGVGTWEVRPITVWALLFHGIIAGFVVVGGLWYLGWMYRENSSDFLLSDYIKASPFL